MHINTGLVTSKSLLKLPRGPESWHELWQGEFLALPSEQGDKLAEVLLRDKDIGFQIAKNELLEWQLHELGLLNNSTLSESTAKAYRLLSIFDQLIGQMAEKVLQEAMCPALPLNWGAWWPLIHGKSRCKISHLIAKLPSAPWWNWNWELNSIAEICPEIIDGQEFVPPTSMNKGLLLLQRRLAPFWQISFLNKMKELFELVKNEQMNSDEALADFKVVYQKLLGKLLPHLEKQKQSGLKTGISCQKCHKGEYIIKHSMQGEFLGCSRFPDCHNTEDFSRDSQNQEIHIIPKEIYHHPCPECKGQMQVKKGPSGARYVICLDAPKCPGHLPYSTEVACPLCPGEIVERKSAKGRKFYGCSQFPECHFTLWAPPIKQNCPHCGFSVMTERENKNGDKFLFCPRCRQK